MSGKRVSKEAKEVIIRDIRAKKQSFQAISRKHSVSISTVSKLAAELGLASPRKKTKPVDVPERSYDRAQRISALDRMLNSIETMVAGGGLSSRQLKDLAGAAKEVYATRRAEDIEPDPDPYKDKKDKDGWVDIGMGDIRIHESDPLLKDMIKIEQGVDLWAERAAKEKAEKEREEQGEYNGEGLA